MIERCQKKQLEITANLSSSTIAKMNKGKGVTTTTLERICRVLDCKIEDVVEFVPDENNGEIGDYPK